MDLIGRVIYYEQACHLMDISAYCFVNFLPWVEKDDSAGYQRIFLIHVQVIRFNNSIFILNIV